MIDIDEALRKRAERYRKGLYRAFGDRIHTDTEAFAMALRDGDCRLPTWLMETESWSGDFEALVVARADELRAAKELKQRWDSESDY